MLVTLAMDTETGEIDPSVPFMVNSRRHGRATIVPMRTSRASSSNSDRARFGSKPSGMMKKEIGYLASEWMTLDQIPPLARRAASSAPTCGRIGRSAKGGRA